MTSVAFSLFYDFKLLGRKFNEKGELISKRSLQPLIRSSGVTKNKADSWSEESIGKFNSLTDGLIKQFGDFKINNDTDLHVSVNNSQSKTLEK